MFSDPDPLAFLTMVRTERHKLVAVHGLDDGELYDLELDPRRDSKSLARRRIPGRESVDADAIMRPNGLDCGSFTGAFEDASDDDVLSQGAPLASLAMGGLAPAFR